MMHTPPWTAGPEPHAFAPKPEPPPDFDDLCYGIEHFTRLARYTRRDDLDVQRKLQRAALERAAELIAQAQEMLP